MSSSERFEESRKQFYNYYSLLCHSQKIIPDAQIIPGNSPAHPSHRASSSSSPPPSTDIDTATSSPSNCPDFKDILNKLCLLIDCKIHGQTVNSLIVTRPGYFVPYQPTFILCVNKKRSTVSTLLHRILELLGQPNLCIHDHKVRRKLLEDVGELLWEKWKKKLNAMYEKFVSACEDVYNSQQSSDLPWAECELVKDLYKLVDKKLKNTTLKHSEFWTFLEGLIHIVGPQKLHLIIRDPPLAHIVGRLHSFYTALRILPCARLDIPDLFFPTPSLRIIIPSEHRPHTVPRLDPIRSIIRQFFPSAGGPTPPFLFPDNSYNCDLYQHCEMTALQWLLSQNDHLCPNFANIFWQNIPFIGISKRPCRPCWYFLEQFPTIKTRPTHDNVYITWGLPLNASEMAYRKYKKRKAAERPRRTGNQNPAGRYLGKQSSSGEESGERPARGDFLQVMTEEVTAGLPDDMFSVVCEKVKRDVSQVINDRLIRRSTNDSEDQTSVRTFGTEDT